MLVRVVRAPRRRLRREGHLRTAAAAAFLLVPSCGPGEAPGTADVALTWTLAPDPPRVGPATLVLHLADGAGRPLRGARLRTEATMSHPGMRPELAEAVELPDGRYQASFRFTMGGEWLVLVSASLPDGRELSRRIDLPHVRPAS